MREPGWLILRLTHALGLTRLRETVVLPAVADMQHECDEVGSGPGRRWAVARGYWSLISGSLFYAAFQPARYLREDWGGLSAPGPRLLRQAGPATAVTTALLIGIVVSTLPNESRLGIGVTALLIPSFVVTLVPLALAVGVGWVLALDRSGSRAAVALGLLSAGCSFAFFDFVVTQANQAYRVASYQTITGRSEPPRKGSREMTFRELVQRFRERGTIS